MSTSEVIQIACIAAEHEGWRFLGPVDAKKRMRLFGNNEWLVSGRTPVAEREGWVRIDAETGEVIATGWRRVEPLARAA